MICIRIGASHFLWKMVRRIVGMLAEVGRGNLTYDGFERLLKFKSDVPAKFTAPPSGLFLEQVLVQGRQTAIRQQLPNSLTCHQPARCAKF